METLKENLTLKAFWRTYKLNLVKSEYLNNWRMYLWLIDAKDWEPFADITENHVEFNIQSNEWIIDNDFISCFKSIHDMYERLEKNLDVAVYEYGFNYHILSFN